MRQIYFRIITQEFNPRTAAQIARFLRNTLNRIGIHDITVQSYISYWKNTSLGELTCQCMSDISLAQIQQQFATVWKSDTADIQWSTIHLPGVCFLWISD